MTVAHARSGRSESRYPAFRYLQNVRVWGSIMERSCGKFGIAAADDASEGNREEP
ncbi:hypothetical protein BH24ACT6_BH24ACT6_01030 [soil metagenome]